MFSLRSFSRLFPHVTRTPMVLSFTLSTVTATLTFALLPLLPPTIPLFYTLSQPNLTLAPKVWIVLLPVLLFTFTLVNGVVAQVLRQFDPILLKLFSWSALLSQTVLALALIRIVWIVL